MSFDLASMKPLHGHEKKVFDAVLVAVDGMTDDDLSSALGIRHQSVSARRRALVLRGYLQSSGRVRPTSSGKRATVWVLGTGKPEAPAPAPPSNDELRRLIASLRDDQLAAVRAWLESFIKPEAAPKTKAVKPSKPTKQAKPKHRRLSGKAWAKAKAERQGALT